MSSKSRRRSWRRYWVPELSMAITFRSSMVIHSISEKESRRSSSSRYPKMVSAPEWLQTRSSICWVREEGPWATTVTSSSAFLSIMSLYFNTSHPYCRFICPRKQNTAAVVINTLQSTTGQRWVTATSKLPANKAFSISTA